MSGVSMRSQVQIIIDNGEPSGGQFSIDVAQIEVSSFSSEPDPQWTFVDAAGHFHAWTDDLKLPTLDERAEWHDYIEPDEETGETGYTTLHLHCVICDEEIHPGRIHPGGLRRFAPGRSSWTAAGFADGSLGEKKSVRIINGYWLHFGIAMVVDVQDDNGSTKLMLAGEGELGKRKAPQPAGG